MHTDFSTALHPAVQRIIDKFNALELHAARSGREVMDALAQVAQDSAATTRELSEAIEFAIDALLEAMPPYAPPLNVMHRLMAQSETALKTHASADDLRGILQREAQSFAEWSATARDRIAGYGAALIPDNAVVFTYTLSETALRTLKETARCGKRFNVLVTESRPNNDGLITARELGASAIDVSVSIDACLAELIAQADIMIVGAEAITPEGDAVCKVGTYSAALVAQQYGVPLYVTADTLKFNVTALSGLSLKLDAIARRDVLSDDSGYAAKVVGSLFDRTPAALIRGIVTERGVLSPQACAALMLDMPISARLIEKLRALNFA